MVLTSDASRINKLLEQSESVSKISFQNDNFDDEFDNEKYDNSYENQTGGYTKEMESHLHDIFTKAESYSDRLKKVANNTKQLGGNDDSEYDDDENYKTMYDIARNSNYDYETNASGDHMYDYAKNSTGLSFNNDHDEIHHVDYNHYGGAGLGYLLKFMQELAAIMKESVKDPSVASKHRMKIAKMIIDDAKKSVGTTELTEDVKKKSKEIAKNPDKNRYIETAKAEIIKNAQLKALKKKEKNEKKLKKSNKNFRLNSRSNSKSKYIPPEVLDIINAAKAIGKNKKKSKSGSKSGSKSSSKSSSKSKSRSRSDTDSEDKKSRKNSNNRKVDHYKVNQRFWKHHDEEND